MQCLGWAPWRPRTACWLLLESHHVPHKPQVCMEYPKSLKQEQIISILHQQIGADLSMVITVSVQCIGDSQPADDIIVARPLTCGPQDTCYASSTAAGCCSDTAKCDRIGMPTSCVGFNDQCNDACMTNTLVLKWYALTHDFSYLGQIYHICASNNLSQCRSESSILWYLLILRGNLFVQLRSYQQLWIWQQRRALGRLLRHCHW